MVIISGRKSAAPVGRCRRAVRSRDRRPPLKSYRTSSNSCIRMKAFVDATALVDTYLWRRSKHGASYPLLDPA